MLFRQLNTHEKNTGTLAKYFFVKRLQNWLVTKKGNGWTHDSYDKYTKFKLEIIK